MSRKFELIVRNRQSGKTTELIRRSAATGAIIVCINYNMVQYTLRKAAKLGLTIPKPITHEMLLGNWLRGKSAQPFLIDDFERLIPRLLAHAIPEQFPIVAAMSVPLLIDATTGNIDEHRCGACGAALPKFIATESGAVDE